MTESWRLGDWMETRSGLRFYPLDPAVEDVDPEDIAHALGMLCRYNGHVRKFYSVAEHCVLMSRWVQDETGDRDAALWALLHDAPEAYVGDMIRPLKRSMPDYVLAENAVMAAIASRFGLEHTVTKSWRGQIIRIDGPPVIVKHADNRILLTERRALMADSPNRWAVDDLEPLPVQVVGWGPAEARWAYRNRLIELGVTS